MHETQEQTGHPPQLFMERKLERADTLISVGTRTHARTGESALCSQEAGVKPRSAGRDPLHTRSESVLRLETSGLLFVQATPVQTLGKGDPTCEPLGANVQLRWPRPRTQWLCSTSRVPGRSLCQNRAPGASYSLAASTPGAGCLQHSLSSRHGASSTAEFVPVHPPRSALRRRGSHRRGRGSAGAS